MGYRKLFFVATCCLVIAPQLLAVDCRQKLLKKEKKISRIYQKLRFTYQCSDPVTYLEFAERAWLAGRLGEAFWAVSHAKRKIKDNSLADQKARVLRGQVFIEMKRFEEAIIELRPLAFSHSKNGDQVVQKAHLALIKAYYLKSRQKDKNVKYLVGLFYKYYPKSKYRPALVEWARNPG